MKRALQIPLYAASIALFLGTTACGEEDTGNGEKTEVVVSEDNLSEDSSGNETVDGETETETSGDAELEEVPDDYAGAENPFGAEDAEAVAAGNELFDTRCAACHGADGEGNTPTLDGAVKKPATFSSDAIKNAGDDYLFWKLAVGGGIMPPFSPNLSDDEIWQLVSYIRTFSE